MFFYRPILFLTIFAWPLAFPDNGKAAVVPVGQLPTVTVSVTPSIYSLPILLVESMGEWKDFGIQVQLKVHPHGEEQLDRIVANEWDVAVMDPFHAVKGGNEGNVAIVGVAGNFASQIPFILNKGEPTLSHGKLGEWVKGFMSKAEIKGDRIFLPACLVATAAYADTRKTLVIRWLEGYSRGIHLVQKNPGNAASRWKAFIQEILKAEIPDQTLQQHIAEAFYFDERDREEPFRGKEGKPSAVEEIADSLTRYLKEVKALEAKADLSEYILLKLCDQLSALRQEATSQLERTGTAIEAAAREGATVQGFRKTWEDARMQIQDGRGCLTVIGVLSDLQRSADQARVASGRLRDFRRIEMAIGGILAIYYAGYVFHRRKRSGVRKHESVGRGGSRFDPN